MTKIVYGPPGCGKTHNAEALRKYFKCSKVVDEWDGKRPLPANSLALTIEPVEGGIHFDTAIKLAKTAGFVS